MAVRPTCRNLIERTRRLIGDRGSATGSTVWTDDELQDVLDERRTDVRYLELTPGETLHQNQAVTWLDYYADYGDWEEDEILYYGGNWSPITPATADRITGHWVFAVSQLPPVLLVGKTFDLYGTAADILERWVALKPDFDFQDGNQNKFSRSQTSAIRMNLAKTYRQKQRVGTVMLVRSDISPDGPNFASGARWGNQR